MNTAKDYPPYLDYPKPRKLQTNADRIRAMNNEELAELLEEMTYDSMEHRAAYWLRWLKQPVKEDE